MKDAMGELETTKIVDPEATGAKYGTTQPESPARSPTGIPLVVSEVRCSLDFTNHY